VENQPVRSDVPALVLAGEFDPITPPAWGEMVAANLQNSAFLVFPGEGHGVSLSECGRSAAITFLNDQQVADPSVECIDDLTGPEFVLPLTQTQMVPYEDDLWGIVGLRPDGWEETNPGVFSRSALGETVLIQQAVPADPEQYLQIFLRQVGASGVPTPAGTRTANALTWTLYEAPVQGNVVDIALAEAGERTLAVIVVGLPGKRDELREHVFFPAVDALTLAP
jgi:hypothetical protein